MITEFKINVADVAQWRDRPEALRSMLSESYSQICVAYSMLGGSEPDNRASQNAEALFIGETLFDFCKSIFPIHVYQPGSEPTDHIVFILQIKDLGGFVEKLMVLGEIFVGTAGEENGTKRTDLVREAIHAWKPRELHFPELSDPHHQG